MVPILTIVVILTMMIGMTRDANVHGEERLPMTQKNGSGGKGWISAVIVVLVILALFMGSSDCRILPETMDNAYA